MNSTEDTQKTMYLIGYVAEEAVAVVATDDVDGNAHYSRDGAITLCGRSITELIGSPFDVDETLRPAMLAVMKMLGLPIFESLAEFHGSHDTGVEELRKGNQTMVDVGLTVDEAENILCQSCRSLSSAL